MSIREIKQDDPFGRELFWQLPYDVYVNDSVWVPEQKERINIFSERERGIVRIPLLAMEGEKAVARLVCILHPQALGDEGKPQGWIGYFEGLKDFRGLCGELLQKAEEVLADLGAASVVVPKTDNQAMGFLVKGFHLPQTVMTTHNPPYYPDLFKSAGYRVKAKAVSFYFRRQSFRPPRMTVPGIRTRELNMGNLQAEMAHFNRLQNAVFAERDGYLSRTPAEDEALVSTFLPFLDEELVIFAEDEEGQPVGILLCLPDSNQALKGGKITRVRIISIGVLPGWEGKGWGRPWGAT
jgi:hypothetical protein